MTKQERVRNVTNVNRETRQFLAQRSSSIDAKSLIHIYCRERRVDPIFVESALTQLLNQGKVQTNRKLQLQVPAEEAA